MAGFMKLQVWEHKESGGYMARYSAPGYMDCTDDNGPFPTPFEAIMETLSLSADPLWNGRIAGLEQGVAMNLNHELERLNRALTSFKVDPKSRFAFGLPVASMPMTCAERLILATFDGSTVMPGDSRWNAPGCRVTGPVDPQVAFAVAVCPEFFEVGS